ncbi:MAG: MCE family protein [Acidobacteria bacterium]|nr:MCE family protein [Acidobacteriota bacterium]
MSSAAKVGAFMLVVLAILGFFILRIEDIGLGGSAKTQTIDVIFPSVAGLDEKSPVRVAGVRVGKVREIRLEGANARATLEIDASIEVRDGARAYVENLGLLGEKYVELYPGAQGAPLASKAKPILGSTQPTIDDVTAQVSKIAEDVKAVSASMRNALGGPEGEQRLEEIVENIRDITARMNMILASNEGNVNATAENLRAITDDLRVEIPRIANSLDRFANSIADTVNENREDVRTIVQNSKELATELRATNDNLNAITGQIRSGQGTVGKLIYDDEALRKLTSSLESVEQGANELRDTLGKARRMEMAVEVKSSYYDGLEEDPNAGFTGNSRGGIGLLLRPNPEHNRFLNLELNYDPRGQRYEKQTTTTVTGPDGIPATTTTNTVKYEKDWVFSAQAAWQVDKTRLRVGVFDGTGGIGADYFVNDRFSVTGEIFDFNERVGNEDPHLRLFSNWTILPERKNFPTLFLSTGVDNVLNDNAVTVGGGIRWSDDDLKYLFGSVPLN